MIRVVQVREEADRLLILSTYYATLGQQSQKQHYYLSHETERVLEEALSKLMNRERETMRAFCYALQSEFTREFPSGLLHAICSYRSGRLIQFEQEQGQLNRISISQLSTRKEIVSLGVSATYLVCQALFNEKLCSYPLITIRGLRRTTSFASPALCTTLTTCWASL